MTDSISLTVRLDHRGTGASDAEVRAGMDAHGLHRYRQCAIREGWSGTDVSE